MKYETMLSLASLHLLEIENSLYMLSEAHKDLSVSLGCSRKDSTTSAILCHRIRIFFLLAEVLIRRKT